VLGKKIRFWTGTLESQPSYRKFAPRKKKKKKKKKDKKKRKTQEPVITRIFINI